MATEQPYEAIERRASALPRFALPGVVGVAMRAEEIADVVQKSVEEMAEGFQCVRLLALSYEEGEGLLRGVTVTGFEFDAIRSLRLPISQFPASERALRTGQMLILSDSSSMNTQIAPHFSGKIVIVPLLLKGRPLSVLIGQMQPGVDPRSTAWQTRAREVAERAALVVELERVASAYQNELSLRQSVHEVGASILAGRPLPDVASKITEIVSESLKEERVGMFLQNEEGETRAVGLRQISEEYGEGISRLARRSPMMARAAASDGPYHARYLQEDEEISLELRALYRREGITSLLIALMQYGDTLLGALIVYPHGERQFTPAERVVFQSMADQATLGVAISQFLEREREIAVIEERNRLAREIHDTVAQSLAGLILQIETAQTDLDSGRLQAAREMLQAARLEAGQALEDCRRAVQGLSPASLDNLSPAQAIAELVRQFEEVEDIVGQFILTGEEQSLIPEQRTALLRIAQESLANARKHAHARRVRVGLQYGLEEVVLLVEDDGIGFNPDERAAPGPEGGYGLFGMTERARLLGGTFQMESTPGWGTRVRAGFPYRPASPLRSSAVLAPTSDASRTINAPLFPETPAAVPPSAAPAGETRPPAESIRVLIADDHAITRQGIRTLLEANGITVVGEAADGEEATEQARKLRPDVVLMDLQMPRVDGLAGLRRIHEASPELAVVILTTFQSDASVAEALSAGARGYLLKDADPADLIASIRAAYRGEALLSSTITNRLSALASRQPGRGEDAGLNERERELLQLLAQGARNKEIAAQLFITTKTVEYHLSNIFVKLGVANRTEAVRAALDRGLILPQPRTLK